MVSLNPEILKDVVQVDVIDIKVPIILTSTQRQKFECLIVQHWSTVVYSI